MRVARQRRRTLPTGAAGMTLIELLVSMTLLAGLGAMIVQLMKNSLDLYDAGERHGEYSSIAVPVIDLLDDDLANIAGAPEGRLIVESRRGGGAGAGLIRLRMVRTPPGGERFHPVLRESGIKSKADGSWVGGDPGPESRASLAPASGAMEVCYMLCEDPGDNPGVLTLYRGVRTPALQGGPLSYFDPDHDIPPNDDWVRKNMTPIVSGVLDLRILCATPTMQEWDEASMIETGAQRGDTRDTWDSTRGILPSSIFADAVGANSRDYTGDDIFPSKVRIILTIARAGKPEARVVSTFKAGDRDVQVDLVDRLPRETDEDRYIKLDGEWVEVTGHGIGYVTVARARRSATSAPQEHGAGTACYSGRTFRKTVEIPVRRSVLTGASR